MIETISPRAQKILRLLTSGEPRSRVAIERATGESGNTTIRELGRLVELGYVSVTGEARATRYTITSHARRLVLWNLDDYLAQEPDQRPVRYTRINPALFDTVRGILRPADVELAAAAHDRYTRRHAADPAAAQRELERFVTELSWKSSKIEGNTYTLLDTEQLLREATEAPGHPHAEAAMILGHKRAFDYIWTHQQAFRRLTRQHLEQIHELLTESLDVPRGIRTSGVGITGTAYVPPASKIEIVSYLDSVLRIINALDQPAEKAIACLVLVPYLQPFIDGNKRTSRLLANAVLLAHGYPPLSYRSVDEQAYKAALILFYEQGALANFRDLFLDQLQFAANNYFL